MLEVRNIQFSYAKQVVLESLSFEIEKGAHLAVVGESGSGKTTLLKLLYGEYDLNEGEIRWQNEPILGPKFNLITGPDFMKHVAQEFDLMPYTSVSANIGNFLSNHEPEKKQKRIDELLEVVELQDVASKHVRYLSGGQKQRVAIAKALAKQPEILLLDEPFSHIDNLKRQSLRRSLFKFLKEKQITCIVATHDKNDVLGFADHMLVLDQGKVHRFDRPEHLYNRPESKLIASFFDEYNEFSLSEISDSSKDTKLLVYPHELLIDESSDMTATISKAYFQGSYYLLEAHFNGRTIFIRSSEVLSGTIRFKVSKSVLTQRQ